MPQFVREQSRGKAQKKGKKESNEVAKKVTRELRFRSERKKEGKKANGDPQSSERRFRRGKKPTEAVTGKEKTLDGIAANNALGHTVKDG